MHVPLILNTFGFYIIKSFDWYDKSFDWYKNLDNITNFQIL